MLRQCHAVGGNRITVEQAISDISLLQPLDQLRVVQAIWDKLQDDIGTELSSSQREELDRRWSEYEKKPSSVLSEDEFCEQVKLARGR